MKKILRYHWRVIGDCLHYFWTGCSSISGSRHGRNVLSSKGIVFAMLWKTKDS